MHIKKTICFFAIATKKMKKINKILNYTHHTITILTEGGAICVPKHGTARCSVTRNSLKEIDMEGAKISINETIFGKVANLPEEKNDTIIIVSAIVANVMTDSGRDDLYTVDEPVRERGIIVGCRALSKTTKYERMK